jgi:hypothetical protein
MARGSTAYRWQGMGQRFSGLPVTLAVGFPLFLRRAIFSPKEPLSAD